MPDPERKNKRSRQGKGRRARGTGSIFWDEERERFVGRKIVGRKPGGAPVYREVSAEKKEDVVEKLKALDAPGDATTVRAWAQTWLDSLTIRPSTRATYTEILDNHILPVLGPLKVVDVKASRVKALSRQLVDKDLSDGTVRKVMKQVGAIFGAAVREEIIDRNPVVTDRKSRGDRKQIHPFTRAELIRIISHVPSTSSGALIALLAAVGCRTGEASALDVGDWNPTTGKVSITKTYSRQFGLGPPKSKNGTREISVPDIVRPTLVAAARGRTTGPLFITKQGKRVVREVVRKAFGRFLRRLKLPVRNPHQLRHSVATAMVAEGVPLADVAKYLGDTIETIVSSYTHPTEADPVGCLNRIFGTGP